MSRRPRLSRLLAAAALAVAAAGASAAPALAADCPKKAGELSRKSAGVIWQSKGSLYLCTAYYEKPPITAKVGPWKKGTSHFAFDGNHVVWAVETNFQEDRIYAANGPRNVWIKGWRPVTGLTGVIDQQVARLAVYGDVAAWVTKEGQVVQAADDAVRDDIEQIGAGTPGAAAPPTTGEWGGGDVAAYKQGLFSPGDTKGRRRIIGRWTEYAKNPAFIKSLKVSIDEGAGDGDECGGVNLYQVTVRPVPGQPRVGFASFVDWTSENCG